MPSRRTFISSTVAVAGALLAAPSDRLALAQTEPAPVKGAMALTRVFGDGQKLVGVAIEFRRPIDEARLSRSSFSVEGRTVVDVHASASASPGTPAASGPYVIVELSPDDAAALLRHEPSRPQGLKGGPAVGALDTKGPPDFGPRQLFRPATAAVVQAGPVVATDGQVFTPTGTPIPTTGALDPTVDAFRSFEYRDPKTGRVLPYNFFVPAGYDASRSYPLVLFMHDAGTLSHDPTTTLKQGLGAVVWASPTDQAKHPCFVLAPQYAEVAVDDTSDSSTDLDATVDLIDALANRYAIDRTRLYATGQSMGAMMSIAMDIRYPVLFAASYIVAGQWDPALVAPLAHQKLWILVSQGDLKAYPGENAMMAALEKDGAKVGRAVWDGRSTPEQFAAAVARMEADGNPINYVALQQGTVVPAGQSDDGGSNHMNTWRIAYTIDGIRDWLFAQRRGRS